ncbi:hypothetical protein [Candidatus Enterovibrio altilux]|uniref:Uncharacterized protein n=1 Tax=Candidatus Enterovibrio altilux TaxID=1927128 RepID=A0A291BAM3_9GAMM|nr:hypothetical protein [Candidatus Enterovibrio luxaltus]ATF10034.1 hypothetical protein BTN50_1561 [Candidatus Enterovibrio luxaltus]
MLHETKTMEVPLAIADKVRTLIKAYEAKETFKAERKIVVYNLISMDNLSCEIAVYSLPQEELLDTLRFVYELSGTNSRFITKILAESRKNPKKILSDAHRTSAKSLLFNLINKPSVISALREN